MLPYVGADRATPRPGRSIPRKSCRGTFSSSSAMERLRISESKSPSRSRTGPDAWRLTQSRKDLGAATPRLAETEGGESSLRLGRYESIIVRLANRSMIDPIELSLKLRLRNRLESNVAEHRAPGRLRHACPTCSPQLASFCIVSQLFQCFPTRLAGCKYRGPRFYNSSDFIDRRGTGSRGRCISIQRARLQTSSFTAY